jgi:hypothetical protein
VNSRSLLVSKKGNSGDLIVVTPDGIEALLATREEDELICDRCLDADEPHSAMLVIEAIDQTFALCGTCTRELPKGYRAV